MRPALSQQALDKYDVNIPGTIETIWQPLYDFQTYETSGATSFTFFQSPVGDSGTTYADTNMESAGMVPRGQNFLITGIEVEFFPAEAALNEIATPANSFINEYYSVMTADAYFELTIGSKPYMRQAPLLSFAPRRRFNADAAVSTTADTVTYGWNMLQVEGDPMDIVPLKLESNQNFNAKIMFDSAVSVNAAGKIGVRLNGYLFRNAQ